MTKNILDIKVGEVKPQVSLEEKRAEMERIIENYKVQNPIKYERKKLELAAKLAKLTPKEVKEVEEVKKVK